MDLLALLVVIVAVVLFCLGKIHLGLAASVSAWALQLLHLSSLVR